MQSGKKKCLGMMVFGILTGCILCDAAATELGWQTSKQAAVELAVQQDKKILLLAGRDACGNTTYQKFTVCEQTYPPVRRFIDQHYIPWFCDVDNSAEWYSYASGLGSYTLPLICVIDPSDSDSYLDRSTGVQYEDDFYTRLQSHIEIKHDYCPAVQLLLLND